jgi:hypothetical protein
MSQSNNSQELKEEFIYLVTSVDKDGNGNSHNEVAQYRKGKFWFFGWEVPEPTEKFTWKELIVSLKND